ncbi:unnamed protein product, partial [Ectocarpus sp. 13 AM-2016]
RLNKDGGEEGECEDEEWVGPPIGVAGAPPPGGVTVGTKSKVMEGKEDEVKKEQEDAKEEKAEKAVVRGVVSLAEAGVSGGKASST